MHDDLSWGSVLRLLLGYVLGKRYGMGIVDILFRAVMVLVVDGGFV